MIYVSAPIFRWISVKTVIMEKLIGTLLWPLFEYDKTFRSPADPSSTADPSSIIVAVAS